MKKKLGQLKINAERVIDNDELINIKGGTNQQCYCPTMGWFTVICGDWQSASIACSGSAGVSCMPC